MLTPVSCDGEVLAKPEQDKFLLLGCSYGGDPPGSLRDGSCALLLLGAWGLCTGKMWLEHCSEVKIRLSGLNAASITHEG